MQKVIFIFLVSDHSNLIMKKEFLKCEIQLYVFQGATELQFWGIRNSILTIIMPWGNNLVRNHKKVTGKNKLGLLTNLEVHTKECIIRSMQQVNSLKEKKINHSSDEI